MSAFRPVVIVVLACGTVLPATATASPLHEAQRLFYSGAYDEAAALALAERLANPDNLAASELRTSALHFAIRRALGALDTARAGAGDNRERAWKACTRCRDLLSEFLGELHLGRAAARARLAQTPADAEALFFLGKLNLNYVWLQLGTLVRRTGWGEYWEARRSLDAALALDPEHVRARVARALIDYIVDTRVPRGVRWVLGGGDRKRGLQTVQDATVADAAPFVQAEAMFALWDLQVRERHLADAVVTARALARDFPENRDLAKFLSTHDLQSSR
ncbi:MAG: hypothetical protein HYU37_01670 [Acidobacteria bacterium]|nr:hypothetical protein [Acidobacteriota bacterium]